MTNDSAIQVLEAIKVLKELVRLPSFSKEEDLTASYLLHYLIDKGIEPTRIKNNVIAKNKYFDTSKPTILLNSHHDTVKPNGGYTKDPFLPAIEEGKLYGLGTNDAGGCLVALMMTFLHFYHEENLKYNLVFAATAEEEISGEHGIKEVLEYLPKIDFAIVGEPTRMQLAVAERGLVVLDAIAKGKAGHAARGEGENAIYKAIKDIDWICNYGFEKNSVLLGPVKMNVTSIETLNKAHNVVPDECRFIIDVRVNELYSLEEVVTVIRDNIQSEIKPRSMRLRSTTISLEHPLVKAGLSIGKTCYGSPTTSDKALMPFPALKMGPGDSARSHIADEYIYVEEVSEGIHIYIQLLNQLLI